MNLSANESRSPGAVILGWWSHQLGDRASTSARGLAARLNRANAIEALSEPAVHALMQSLGWQPSQHRVQALLRLARVLPMVREHASATLARRLGQGEAPAMSALRFQRLIRAEGDELVTALRRALPLVDRRCNVAALGSDLVFWHDRDDRTRTRWCFDYFGAAVPAGVAGPPLPEEKTT